MTSADDDWKASQRLSRDWKRGKLTTEQFQAESLKLSVDQQERLYLRCAFHLLEARTLLVRAAEELERADSHTATVDEIRPFLAELDGLAQCCIGNVRGLSLPLSESMHPR